MSEKRDRVVFDGDCGFCRRATAWIARRDTRNRLELVARQSEAGACLLNGSPPNSIVLVTDSRTYYRSDASLQIARRLGFPYFLISVLLIVPRPIRDWVYGIVARNRHRLGK